MISFKSITLVALSLLLTGKLFAQTTAIDSLPVMTFDEFAVFAEHNVEKVNQRPIVLYYKHSSGGELLYFGSSHIYDPKHAFVNLIESFWKVFNPTVAYWEGGDPGKKTLLPVSKEECIKSKGEPGLVRYLAREYQVTDATLEPPMQSIIKEQLKTFTQEQLIVSAILSQAAQFNKRKEQISDSIVLHMLSRAAAFGFTDIPKNLDELKKSIKKHFPHLKNWKQVPEDMVAPKGAIAKNRNFIQHMGAISNNIRDRYMVKLLLEEVVKGKRVFAVVGASHIIQQEPAFEAFFNNK